MAGAATACQLTAAGKRRVLVLERESGPGVHSSGRNAAMVRQVVADPVVAELSRRGARYIAEETPCWKNPPEFARHGSLLLGSGEDFARFGPALEACRAEGVEVRELGPREAVALHPLLEGAAFEQALYTPSDGWVDVRALLDGYLAEARRGGAVVWADAALSGVQRRPPGGFVLETSKGKIGAGVLVNAAGAWAEEVARLAGAPAAGLAPHRRHLFDTAPVSGVEYGWPFVWHLGEEVYFRPNGTGLMLCPCDEDPFPPGDPQAVPEAEVLLREKLGRAVPRLAEAPVVSGRAGLRVLAPGGRSVVGWDPALEGFFWVAGLGGHGVTASGAIGQVAARLLTGGKDPLEKALAPGRGERPRRGAMESAQDA